MVLVPRRGHAAELRAPFVQELLVHLHVLHAAPQNDLSALVGENLAYLNLANAPITSVRPLLEEPNLRGLVVADSCPDIDSLRVKAGLAFLSHSRFDENAAVFWAQRDARQAE